jgi:hypothetical protein
MGREAFAELWQQVGTLQRRGYLKLYVYGTTGFGRSHILAVLACLLIRIGRRAVYLSDYQTVLDSPVECIRDALLLAFSGDPSNDSFTTILGCEKLGDLTTFCQNTSDILYFIVDQTNVTTLSTTTAEEKNDGQPCPNSVRVFQLRNCAARAPTTNK